MGNGFAQHQRLFLGVAYRDFVVNFADAGGAYPGDAKNVYEDAARTLPVTTVTADEFGMARWYADGVYKMFIEDSLGNPLWTDDNVQMTSDMGTEYEENLGLAAPAASLENLGQMFLKLDASNVFDDLEINTGDDPGFSFKSLIATYLANQPLTDIKLKLPVADVRAYGAVCDGVTDDSAAVNSAITALSSGGTLLYPPACTTRQLNVALDDKIDVVGLGGSVVKLTDAATGTDNLFSGSNKRNINFYNITLDGNNKGGATNVLRFSKTSGSFMYVKLHNIKVENHEGWAVYATGTAGTDFNPITIIDCSFEELERAVHMRYCKPIMFGNQLNNINKSAGSKGIYLGDCTGSLLGFNRVSGYGASGIGIQLDSCSDSLVGYNDVRGTEAYGIIANGASDWNLFTNNNVRGGHSTKAMSIAGSNTIVGANLGTSLQQGQQLPTSPLSIGSFLHTVKTGTTTASGVTARHIEDADSTAPWSDKVDPSHDLIVSDEHPEIAFYIEDPLTSGNDDEIECFTSSRMDSGGGADFNFAAGHQYEVFDNIRHDEGDVTGNIWEQIGADLNLTGVTDSDTHDIHAQDDVRFIMVQVYTNGGTANITSVDWDYGAQSGVGVLSVATSTAGADTFMFRFFIKTNPGVDVLTINTGGSGAGMDVNVRVFHHHRPNDFTGSFA